MKKNKFSLLLCFVILFFFEHDLAAQNYVKAQPRAHSVSSKRGRSPGRGFVWVKEDYKWVNGNYVWSGGWVRPPYPGAIWIPGRWNRAILGWYWTPGHWRRASMHHRPHH